MTQHPSSFFAAVSSLHSGGKARPQFREEGPVGVSGCQTSKLFLNFSPKAAFAVDRTLHQHSRSLLLTLFSMKVLEMVALAWLLALSSLVLQARCKQPVNCQWGPYGVWSECDGCTKTQIRTRSIQAYAQFGGALCSGDPTESQSCTTQRSCPLETGCGERFRCSSGQCISQVLVCNGDQDCEEDGSDEQQCEESSISSVCDKQQIPPNAELTGKGFDILKGHLRSSVINTKSFGGQCRKVFSGDLRSFYRLPRSLLSYTFQVSAENDFSDEFYNSSWSYVKDINNRKTSNRGHDYYMFHDEVFNTKTHRLMVIKNQVEVAQFQNSPPEYLSLSEDFWKALSFLPTVYNYAAYRGLIEKYGTHFLSEGSLGGRYQALLYIDAEVMDKMTSSITDFHECVTKTFRFLFVKWSSTKCRSFAESLKTSKDDGYVSSPIVGGHPAYIAGLSNLDVQNPEANWNMYSKWAGSVKDFPTVINQKLRPLYELLKEVPCAALKKLHLKRALDQYLAEEHPCHCQPCRNNGQPLLRGSVCSCVCKPGTSGSACEYGAPLDDPPGAIHGSWTCWSSWSACSRGQRSRARTCSNPYPAAGGKHCNGEAEEQSACDDDDLAHLRTMEPHCFDPSLSPPKSCKTPPPLQNGFVSDPKDSYPVGSRVVYGCIEGFHLLGDGILECGEDLAWSHQLMECKGTVCGAPPLPQDVAGDPWKVTYDVGERILLSCPPGRQLEGTSEILCDSSLNWSPKPKIKCNPIPEKLPHSKVQCKPWEKRVDGSCVCRMPYECMSSLEVCATNLDRGQTSRLTVCQVRALQCLGRRYALAEDSACKWLVRGAARCPDCQMWERCDEETGACVCRKPEECLEPGSSVCARVGEDTDARTMTECEAGLRRCRGGQVTVVDLQSCFEAEN
ncbi:complement component C7-like [Arapaima gigas]